MSAPTTRRLQWYHAATLQERRNHHQHMPLTGDVTRAQRRLARWRKQPPFDVEGYFDQRLAEEELTQQKLLVLLGEPMEAVAERSPVEFGWLATLQECYGAAAGLAPKLRVPDHWKRHPGLAFWGFVEPIARRAVALWLEQAKELLRIHPRAPFAPDSLSALALGSLPHELLDMPMRTLVLELNVARLQGQLGSQTPQERFSEFAAQLERPEAALEVLEEYPVLARQLVTCVESWQQTTLELLERLCQDWTEVASTFTGARASDQLLHIQNGAGDKHRGGRSVAVLTFKSGFRLVYKPRSLAVDVHFQQLLRDVNTWMGEALFRPLALLDCDSYGWSEFIEASPCASIVEVQRFYQRQGGYLALLYMLRATDIHFENVIAQGENPVIVDLESLLHPDINQDAPSADAFISDSVLQIGLLPIRIWSNDESPGIDMSGLGMGEGQLTPRAAPYWADDGTERMRLARQHRQVRVPNRHRPVLDGRPASPLEHVEELVTGFTAVYHAILAHREKLLAEGGGLCRFAQDDVRVLLRPTQLYSLMLQESFHPDFLRDALERERFLDKLWVQVPKRPSLRRCIRSEQEDLRRGDIPFFWTTPDSKHLWSSTGECLAGFFAEPAMELAKRRLRGFGDRDLARQVWFIRASLAIRATGGTEQAALPMSLPATGALSAVTPEFLLRGSMAIGDRLHDWAMQQDESAAWIGLMPDAHRCFRIAALDNSLYDGQAGIVLFLAYLGHITGVERYTSLAHKACRALLHRVERGEGHLEAVGAFKGVGGVIYVLCHLASLWRRPSLLDEAHRLVGALSERIEQDESMDIMSGVAGCIVSLAALYRQSPAESTLRVMIQCGDRLLARALRTPQGVGWRTTGEADVPMTGFSHGTAGIAAALLELSAFSGAERFREMALAALAYERNLFSPEHGNWPDVRITRAKFDRVDWCHGAPGIGLARLRCLPLLDDSQFQEEIETAVRTTFARGFGHGHSLCHGDLGNLELLLLASARLPGLALQADIQRQIALTLGSVETIGWRCGLPLGVETPGFMVGLAGIGYGLLRIFAPERIPSILSLEPPLPCSSLPGTRTP